MLYVLLTLFAAAIVAVDQWTKALAAAQLAGRTVVLIPGWLQLHYITNDGMALSLLSGKRWFFVVIALVYLVFIVWAIAKKHIRKKTELWLIAAITGGAIGNLIDRVIYAEGFLNGKVVDFLNYGWSIGNVADIFLMLAGVAAVLLLFLGEPFSQKDLDEANGKTLGDDANATDDGTKAA